MLSVWKTVATISGIVILTCALLAVYIANHPLSTSAGAVIMNEFNIAARKAVDYYRVYGTYKNICTNEMDGFVKTRSTVALASRNAVSCNDSEHAWAMATKLQDTVFCEDSLGINSTTANDLGSSTKCK